MNAVIHNVSQLRAVTSVVCSETMQLLTFILAGERFAIGILAVKKIIEADDQTSELAATPVMIDRLKRVISVQFIATANPIDGDERMDVSGLQDFQKEMGGSPNELVTTAGGRLLDQIVPNIRKTSDLVQEITAASEEQSSGVGQTTQQNASSSEELAATVEGKGSQAEHLQQTMAFFKLATTPMMRRAAPAASATTRSSAKSRRPAEPLRAQLPAAVPCTDETHFTRF